MIAVEEIGRASSVLRNQAATEIDMLSDERGSDISKDLSAPLNRKVRNPREELSGKRREVLQLTRAGSFAGANEAERAGSLRSG